MHKPVESTLRIKVCKPLVWECKPTWEEQLKHDLLVASARGHVDVFFYENLTKQIARKAAPAAAHAAYAAVHFTSAAGTPARVARANGLLEATATYLVAGWVHAYPQ